jgi:glutathione S-transferase
MDLYYAPLACSLATRIALYEAGARAEFIYVDIHTHSTDRRLIDGSDYFAINPMGQVPAVRIDGGELITENPVVLQYVADQYPDSGLAPRDGLPRYRLQEWLNFIGTELHKGMYIPLLGRSNPEGAKDFARQKTGVRLGHVESHLKGREFLLDRFTIADAYLFTVLNWSQFAGVDLSPWPAVQAYYRRLLKRPTVAKALKEEQEIYAWEQARKAAA